MLFRCPRGEYVLWWDDYFSDGLVLPSFFSHVWQSPHAPQFPPQEQDGLPFFFFIISFATTAIKSIAITAVMIIVIIVPFVIVFDYLCDGIFSFAGEDSDFESEYGFLRTTI